MVAFDIWDVEEKFESYIFYCGRGRLGNAPDCGSGLCGFKAHRPPLNNMSSSTSGLSHGPFTAASRVQIPYWMFLAQWLSWLERRPVTAEVEGSSPFWVV